MRFVLFVLIILSLFGLAGCLPGPAPSAEGVLRVMTFNIHHGEDMAGHLNLQAVAATIRSSGAGIVALQEVDRGWSRRSGYLDEAAFLAEKLGMYLAFGATLDQDPAPGKGEYGLAILSRFPISDYEMHLLPGSLEQRGVLLAHAETPFGMLPVACTHLGLSAADRWAQIEDMLAWLPTEPSLLLLGDFGTEPSSPELAVLHQTMTDVQDKCGMGEIGTYFYDGQWVRIDCIFAGTAWQPSAARVVPTDISDHRPVIADLTFTDEIPGRPPS